MGFVRHMYTEQRLTLNPHSTVTTPLSVPPSTLAQPIALDTNGLLKIDLLGITPNSNHLSIWKNTYNESNMDLSPFTM